MKLPATILLLAASCLLSNAQHTGYDKTLADSLGADEYGMKMYVLVILKTGPASISDQAVTDSLFRGHMNNIDRLAREGKLTVAGPFKKNEKKYRGIFIFNAGSAEEAQKLINTDPALKAGLFEAEFYEWYGSAALPTYLPNHKKIERQKP